MCSRSLHMLCTEKVARMSPICESDDRCKPDALCEPKKPTAFFSSSFQFENQPQRLAKAARASLINTTPTTTVFARKETGHAQEHVVAPAFFRNGTRVSCLPGQLRCGRNWLLHSMFQPACGTPTLIICSAADVPFFIIKKSLHLPGFVYSEVI